LAGQISRAGLESAFQTDEPDFILKRAGGIGVNVVFSPNDAE
jgi:hypothetical protein